MNVISIAMDEETSDKMMSKAISKFIKTRLTEFEFNKQEEEIFRNRVMSEITTMTVKKVKKHFENELVKIVDKKCRDIFKKMENINFEEFVYSITKEIVREETNTQEKIRGWRKEKILEERRDVVKS